MKSRSFFHLTGSSTVLLAVLLAACGDPPQLVERFTAPAAVLPTGAPYFAGHLQLKGDLAAREAGAVFVAVRAVVENETLLVRKYDLGGPGFGPVENGARTLRFELGPENLMMAGGPPRFPAALQLWVFFDGDGSVDTKDDRISTLRPVELGDQEVHLELPES